MTQEQREALISAASHRAAGRWAEAAAAYRSVLAQRGDLPNAWYNLGFVERQLGRWEAALAAYQRALELNVAQPEEVRLNRAVILLDGLNREAEGEAELKAALALNPQYAPALLNLANLAEDRGRRVEAEALYARLLALPDAPAEGLARYLAMKGAESASAPLLQRARAITLDDRRASEDRISVGFALGKALDSCGAYEEAIEAYSHANALQRATTPAHLAYDRAAHEARVDAIIAAHPLETRPAPVAADEPNLVFIVGLFRSGSTLCEQVLSGHQRVTAGGELPLIPQMAQAAADEAALRGRYLEQTQRLYPGFDILTDKRPDNYLHVGLIKRLFPKAKIVHTVRDLKDNALSLYFLYLSSTMSYAQDLGDIAHYIRQYKRLMAHWSALFGPDIAVFHYDDFVQAPRQAMEPVLRGLGLEWDDQFLSFHERGARVRTASVWQVREPLYQRSSGRWRNYAPHLAALDGL